MSSKQKTSDRFLSPAANPEISQHFNDTHSQQNYEDEASPIKKRIKSQMNEEGPKSKLVFSTKFTIYKKIDSNIDEMSREEFEQYLGDIQYNEDLTEQEKQKLQKQAIIQKSIDEVKKKYQQLDDKRKHPQRYQQVKSKVKGNLKVQRQRSIQKGGSKKDDLSQSQDSGSLNQSLNKSLDVHQYGMSYKGGSPWKEHSIQKIQKREDDIKAREEEFEKLKSEMEQKRQNNPNLRNSASKIKQQYHSVKQSIGSEHDLVVQKELEESIKITYEPAKGEDWIKKYTPVKKQQKRVGSAQGLRIQNNLNKSTNDINQSAIQSNKKEQLPRKPAVPKLSGKKPIINQSKRSPIKEQQPSQALERPVTAKPKPQLVSREKSPLQSKPATRDKSPINSKPVIPQRDKSPIQAPARPKSALNKSMNVSTKTNTVQRGRVAEANQKPQDKTGTACFVESREAKIQQLSQVPSNVIIKKKGNSKTNSGYTPPIEQPLKTEVKPEPKPVQPKQEEVKAPAQQKAKTERRPKAQRKGNEPKKHVVQKKKPNYSALKIDTALSEKKHGTSETPNDISSATKKKSSVGFSPTKLVNNQEYELSSHDSWESRDEMRADLGKDEQIEVKKSVLPENHKFYNKDLVSKTEQIQSEFDDLMSQLQRRRDTTDPNSFYDIMDEFYGRDDKKDKKHSSPTKRLIQQKDTATEHKKVMRSSNIDQSQYSLTYVTGDGKSYIIAPHEGKLNYNLAEKNPLKFYDQVFNQDVTTTLVKEDKFNSRASLSRSLSKSPVRRSQTLTTAVTKRSTAQLCDKIANKLLERLKSKLGDKFGDNILVALQDKKIENKIRHMYEDDKIQYQEEEADEVGEIASDGEKAKRRNIKKSFISMNTVDFNQIADEVAHHIEEEQHLHIEK